MHLGNGAITTECMVITATAATAGLAWAGWRAQREEPVSRSVAVGLAALIFAAQAFNFPIAEGVSAHLLGGVLLARLVGPGLSAWLMAAVLATQALLLGDGGLGALGANIVQMALLPAALVAAADAWRNEPNQSRSPLIAGILASSSVLVAAGLIALETGAFRSGESLAHWSRFSSLLLATHLPVALIEGVLTAGLVLALAPAVRDTASPARKWALVGLSLAAAALVAVLTPWASGSPDGYEAAAERSGWTELLASPGASALASQLARVGEPLALVVALAVLVAAGWAVLVAVKRSPLVRQEHRQIA